VAFQNTTNLVRIITTDGAATGTNSFTIFVQAPRQTGLMVRPAGTGQLQLCVSGEEELDHILQVSTNLVDWTAVKTNSRAVTPYTNTISTIPGQDRAFFRLLLGP
jgi:hypothetical protein